MERSHTGMNPDCDLAFSGTNLVSNNWQKKSSWERAGDLPHIKFKHTLPNQTDQLSQSDKPLTDWRDQPSQSDKSLTDWRRTVKKKNPIAFPPLN